MQKILLFVLLIVFNINTFANQKPTLVFYCGSAMVKPIVEIAKIIEKKYDCKIRIVQGSSKDLYNILRDTKRGDLYLPGSNSFRENNLKEGYLLDVQYIGYNQAVIFVQKSNSKNLKTLDDFLDENIATMLCNPASGSIGRMTKEILLNYKGDNFFESVYDNSVRIGIDSRDVNDALVKKEVDATINWKAVAFWSKNMKSIDIVQIDEKYAPKKELYINLLKFSIYPDIAKKFMSYAASKKGQEIMKKHGFLD
jgi:molybdate transport system substrate-binding protein